VGFEVLSLQKRAKTFINPKGQIKPKADWRAIDSHKKRMNEFVFFAMTNTVRAPSLAALD
jgi:hypothetical protein